MNCQRVREVLPELLDRCADRPAHADVRAHVAMCPDCQRELAALTQTAAALDAMPTPQPSPRLRKNFYAMLAEEKLATGSAPALAPTAATARRAPVWRWILAPVAGCLLLTIGFIAGRQPTPAHLAADNETRAELKKLQDQMNKMGQLVAISLLQQQQGPANDRLRGVLASARTEQPSDKVLDDLVSALAFDPSANVRLRALEALYPHAEREVVRAGILAALPREQNPLVQLELIDFVAAAEDRAATPALERISLDESTDQSVRTAAQRALARF